MIHKSNLSKSKHRFFFLGSIKSKLISLFIIIGIIPVLIVGIISYNKSFTILQDKLNVTSEQTLGEISRGINNYFTTLSSSVIMLSNNSNIKELSVHPEYEKFTLNLLTEVKTSSPDISSIYFAMPSKQTLVFPTYKFNADYDPTKETWYTEAVNNKGLVTFSKPFKDLVSGKSVVSISKTVEYDSHVVGVISMNVDLDNLSNQFSKINIGKKGYLYIADSDGVVITHPQRALIGTNAASKLSVWEELKKGTKGYKEYNEAGANKFIYYNTNKLTDWKLIASLDESELLSDTNVIKKLTLILLLVIGLLTSIIAYFISGSMSKNTKKLKHSFEKASAGDFSISVNIKSKDEFGDLGTSFNKMIENISALISDVKNSSDTINKTSDVISVMSKKTSGAVSEVSVTMDQIANGTMEQSRNIESGVEELQALAKEIDDITMLTEEMGKISQNTNKLSKSGLNIVSVLIEKSQITNNAAAKVGNVVSEMNTSTDKIEMITKTITDITDRTNLLALNAAIEAARAGEAGKGFAVVAEEVRKLAEQATISTKQIQNLAGNIKEKTKSAVEAVDFARSTIADQEKVVNETKRTFGYILTSIEKVISQISTIENSVKDIYSRKNSVVEKIESVSAVSEQTSASTQEVSSAAEEVTAAMSEFISYASQLKKLSEILEDNISKFKLS